MYSEEYQQGIDAYKAGKSIHYNPYRHKGTPTQHSDWIAGWTFARNENESE